MNNLMGLIFTGENLGHLGTLTAMRDVAAVPVASRYRIVDFIISSMVNSGARNVGLIVQQNYHSLMDHLGTGKEWDLHGKRRSLTILPPYTMPGSIGMYNGLLDSIKSNIHFLRRCTERYVVVTEANMLYTARFDEMLAKHVETNADITVMYNSDPALIRSSWGRYINVAVDGRVTDLEINPVLPNNSKSMMGAFIIRRELLIELVDRAIARGQYHFTREVLIDAIHNGTYKVYGWENTNKVWRIENVNDYYNASMDLLCSDSKASLFKPEWPILTPVHDEMSSRLCPGSQVKNSLIADGCKIEGTVENCVIFRGVQIKKGAVVRNCVIMQDSMIMENAHLEGVILDKECIVREEVVMISPKSCPNVLPKGAVI